MGFFIYLDRYKNFKCKDETCKKTKNKKIAIKLLHWGHKRYLT